MNVCFEIILFIIIMSVFRTGVYLGHAFDFTIQQYVVSYNSGGAGYLLDRVATRRLAESLDDPKCNPHHEVSTEDIYVAICLRNILPSIFPTDTRSHYRK